jgi:hypothetical protein
MSEFINKIIEDRYNYEYSKRETLLFLHSIKKSKAYISGEFIIYILNNINNKFLNKSKNKFLMTLYINWSNFLSFIILNKDDISDISLYFDTIYIYTLLYVKIHTKHFYKSDLSMRFEYIIYIVPDDINIIDYIKNKSISTTSDIWFYDNKIDGTNLSLSLEKKGYLKEKYLNLFIDNLDKNIINMLKYYAENDFEIIVNTSKYNKKEIKYDNMETKSILSFLIYFYKYPDMLQYFYNEINSTRYSNLDKFRDYDILLLNKLHFILSISNNNNYNLDRLKSIFYNLHRDNYSELITIIENLIGDEYKYYEKYLKYLINMIKNE